MYESLLAVSPIVVCLFVLAWVRFDCIDFFIVVVAQVFFIDSSLDLTKSNKHCFLSENHRNEILRENRRREPPGAAICLECRNEIIAMKSSEKIEEKNLLM